MSFSERCLAALSTNQPFPRYADLFPEATLEDAYATQAEFVALRASTLPVVGFKAALTNAPAQTAMGIDTPIVGVLFADAVVDEGSITVPEGALIETEIGFRLEHDVELPVSSDDLGEGFASPRAMVEIALPNIDGRPTAVDLVATNSASYRIIEGAPLNVARIDDVMASLHGRETLFSGSAGDVMNRQSHALAWLINTLLDLGYPLRAGHLLMTGSIGGVAPAQAGAYRARFADADHEIAAIDFELSESRSG